MNIHKETLLTDRLEIRLDADTHALLKNRAGQQGVSIGALVRSAVSVVYREEPQRVNRSGRVLQRKILAVPVPQIRPSSYNRWDTSLSLPEIVEALGARVLSVCETYPTDSKNGGLVNFMGQIVNAISVEGQENLTTANINVRSYIHVQQSADDTMLWRSSLLGNSLEPISGKSGRDSDVLESNVLTSKVLNEDPGYAWDEVHRPNDGRFGTPYRKLIIYDKSSQISFTLYLRGQQLSSFIAMTADQKHDLASRLKTKLLIPVAHKAAEISLNSFLVQNRLGTIEKEVLPTFMTILRENDEIYSIPKLWLNFLRQKRYSKAPVHLTPTMQDIFSGHLRRAIDVSKEDKIQVWFKRYIKDNFVAEQILYKILDAIMRWTDCTQGLSICDNESTRREILETLKQYFLAGFPIHKAAEELRTLFVENIFLEYGMFPVQNDGERLGFYQWFPSKTRFAEAQRRFSQAI